MRQRRLLALGTLGATLATLLITSSPAMAQPVTVPAAGTTAAAPTSDTSQAKAPRKVTLFTGDRVTVTGGQVSVTPRTGVQFIRFQRDDEDYVVPSDAIPLLKADRLDERLFDVTALLDFDFDKLSYLPLVVSHATAVHGLSAQQKLGAVDGFATRVPISDLAKTWQTTRTSLTDGKIWLDGVEKSTLDVSVPMIGAPEVWAAGYDGTGVKVAVLDSGIDDTHPDLAGKVTARQNFVPDKETGLDLTGHGTHVASTIAGSGAASGGRYKGVAPGASLMDGKVCWHVQGNGAACSDSAILQGMQWAASSGAKVVNMSIGGKDDVGLDPLEQAINDLSAQYGILFVCSAGNWGGNTFTVGSPSTADAALSVANFDKTGALNWTSLQGPRAGDYAVKPEIGAPGTDITAARSPSAVELPEGQYTTMSGTSMATPHVTGSAALLAQVHPDWTGQQLKETLMASASPNPAYGVFAQGAGFENVAKALDQKVTVSPASLNVGALEWPHTEAPSTRTMTYRNGADQPVTLDLSLNGDVPDGLLTLDAKTLTVPAGGAATVGVTVDEKASTAYSFYGGWLVATAGDVTLRTPFSVYLEPPSATLNVSAIGRDGGAPGTVMLSLSNPDPQNYTFDTVYTSNYSMRVPLNSTWHVAAYVLNDDGTTALLTNNKVVATEDQNVVLDARKAKPLDVTVPDRKASGYDLSAMVVRGAEGVPTYEGLSGEPGTLLTADEGPTNLPGVVTQVQAVFQAPAKKGSAPDVYQFGWRTTGSFITGFTKHVSRKDLATVDVDYAQNATGVTAVRTNHIPEPSLAGGAYPLSSELPPVATPTHRTEYYGGDVRWRSGITETSTGDVWPILDLAQHNDMDYRAGRRYQERWDGAALDTTVTALDGGSPAAIRQGDSIYAAFGYYADGEGHVGTSYSVANQHLTLSKGDTVLGESTNLFGSWDVAAEPTTYQLRYAVDLPAPYRLSNRLESVWTFTTSADQQGELPLTSIGFRPDLALDNSSRAGSTLTIPLTFAQQANAGKVTSAKVSVSFDDGATWAAAPTAENHGEYTAKVRQPNHRAGFVSLRATAVDSKGNTVTTTVYRAYALT